MIELPHTLNLPPEPQLVQLATQVQANGQVSLGTFDEGELLALGIYPLGRRRIGNGMWPPYLGLDGGADLVLAAAIDHPEVQAAGQRLAERGLALATARNTDAPTGWQPVGDALLLKLLCTRNNGVLGWFSGPSVKPKQVSPAAGLNGTIGFSWLGPEVEGLCLIQSIGIRGEPDSAQPLTTQATVARPDIAAQHVVQVIYRDPLTDEERSTATGTRCGVILDVGQDTKRFPLQFEFWHEWNDAVVFNLPPRSGPPRRGILASRKGILDAESLTAVITKMTTDFIHHPS